ncbi:uncharacterized protein A4U43_C04F3000 [Asparagus officinalis]|uniref:Uncharacterized protein n=1 Tax=Asparagus officinalis TaxID=4686 RepID=A0A5P1EYC0_ASPOF|nr:uncharacterized protein A4U43_C04F3000 [Asparagus officinalis]
MSKEEIRHLFEFGNEEATDMLNHSQENVASSSQVKNMSLPYSSSTSPSDKIMESLLRKHSSWIASYHEHETLLQENEAERLTKEEQDKAWKSFQQSLEWEEVYRTTTFDDHERKPVTQKAAPSASTAPQLTKLTSKSRPCHQRKCNNLAHMLTLRSQNIKSGQSTTCGECSQEISWENLNRDVKSRFLSKEMNLSRRG